MQEQPYPKAHRSPKRDWSQCCYCGIEGEPLTAKDLPLRAPGGFAWRLAAACVNTRGCGERIRARDAHMDQRFTITEAGRAALAAAEASEVA
jgi:hypothetical protein